MEVANASMRLPERYEQAMRELLGEEAEAFFATYEMPRTSGLRWNGLKLGPEETRERLREAGATPIPWAEGGMYTEEGDRPGKHLNYYLGLYYIQEPSAMLPAELLDVRPGHRVLDLCAAPGGKSTQIVSKLRGRGILVTNDNAAERTKALAKNVERAGAANVVVANEEPARLAEAFGAYFDRVLVDAPCSGEGMFRKDEDMVRQWERHSVERCSAMQRDILREAAKLVAPGGKLLYSTCTFSPRENEGSIATFLAEHPQFAVERIEAPPEWGLAPGRPDWLSDEEKAGLDESRLASLAGTARVWPHRVRGEGHYAALLSRRPELAGDENRGRNDKADRDEEAVRDEDGALDVWSFPEWNAAVATESGTKRRSRDEASGGRRNGSSAKRGNRGFVEAAPLRSGKHAAASGGTSERDDMRDKLLAFAGELLPHWRPRGRLLARGEQLYLLPEELPELGRLNLPRPGWLLGTATKHRFEPSQALAMGLRMTDASRSLRLRSDEDDAIKYMKGETLHPAPARIVDACGMPADGRGWTLVCVDGHPAGWGRWDGTLLKNELLPGWRWM